MADFSPLDRDLAASNSPPLVDARLTERLSEDPPEHATIRLPYRFAPVTPGLLDSPPAQGARISPDAKLFQEPDSPFVPPARPSSTPYPFVDTRETACSSTSDFSLALGSQNVSIPPAVDDPRDRSRPATHFTRVPVEVHEVILDHLFGVCAPISLRAGLWSPSSARGLGRAPRSSRRRETTQLALINSTWRVLVQKRLYRHIKLKGTLSSIDQAISHFAGPGQRLANYVKHIEIWFPVFQPRYPQQAISPSPVLPVFRSDGGLPFAIYTLPGDNCTLQDVFQFVSLALPCTKILTLEGGERRKAPKVVHSHHHNRHGLDYGPILPIVSSVTTLVTKGQWNLMRDNHDFVSILGALPNIEEWRGAYSKPKSKSYITISQFLPYIPAGIKHLSLCLENDYRREAVVPAFFAKASRQAHICTVLAKIVPSLERFSYTGRVCHQFFQVASQSAFASSSRLRSIDLTLKNCCRHSNIFSDSGSGIQDKGFIAAFERLVISAVKSLAHFHRVEYMRIRFVDLDSAVPGLNPYFLFQHGECSGVWSDKIINEMAKARPGSKFPELSESFGNISYTKEGRLIVPPELSRTRMTSIKIANYEIFENRVIAV
ncbi:hypothetical protein ISF_05247 [Cordyceps fumosorosea ARSEF 2679]|uniref:Uncharacterized protein n=1 Tax=Cordyceps fumosorosea (strain ARSEF 2679) TaxID=1081104 RepID=A0A167V599_CORFA|nr:hypothetical protein ISF_05247 [Cordyceps fumosorosea ARSEF 2679]OAA62238.1 hypothetical protein ISF_05247 [Cordyceps fumosorosea ARSEF 2679]